MLSGLSVAWFHLVSFRFTFRWAARSLLVNDELVI